MDKEKDIQIIYPGIVFTAKNYDPFTKKVLSHPFVCIYDQALDDQLEAETNILGLLITSNNKQYSRQVPILKSKDPFLDKDSFCYCNNIYMFLKSDVNPIGQMDSDTFFEIVKKRQMLLRGENDQCVQALMNMKAYEFKLKQKEKEKEKEKNKSVKHNNMPQISSKKADTNIIAPHPLDIDRLNNNVSRSEMINKPQADYQKNLNPSNNANAKNIKKKHHFFGKKRGESPKGGIGNN